MILANSKKIIEINEKVNSKSIDDLFSNFNPDLSEEDKEISAVSAIIKSNFKEYEVKLLTLDKILNFCTNVNFNNLSEEPKEGRNDPSMLQKGYIFTKLSELGNNIESLLSFKDSKIQEVKLEKKENIDLNLEFINKLYPNEFVIVLNEDKDKKDYFKRIGNVHNKNSSAFELIKPDNIFKVIYKFTEGNLVKSLVNVGYNIYTDNLSRKKGFNLYQTKSFESQLALISALDFNNNYFYYYGRAGTGKTYTALFMALMKVMQSRIWAKPGSEYYNPEAKLYLTKPIVPMAGLEHETLTGGPAQKEIPYYQSIIRNYQTIMNNINKSVFQNKLPDSLMSSIAYLDKDLSSKSDEEDNKNFIRILPLRFTRGTSLQKGDVLLVDESQNLTYNVIRDILTRQGGSSVFFVGDPYQLDNKFNSINYNGVTVALSKLFNPRFSNYNNEVLGLRSKSSVLNYINTVRSNEFGAIMTLFK